VSVAFLKNGITLEYLLTPSTDAQNEHRGYILIDKKEATQMSLPGAVVLLVAAMCLLFAYFVVGSLVRYRKGLRSFPEVLPNYTFWRRVGWGIRSAFYRVVSCGKYTPPTTSESAVLPSKPRRDFGFEELPDDNDDYDDYDENGAISSGSGGGGGARAGSEGGVVVVHY
jgi:hypothetical protein